MSHALDAIKACVKRIRELCDDKLAIEEMIPRATGLLDEAVVALDDAATAQEHEESNRIDWDR